MHTAPLGVFLTPMGGILIPEWKQAHPVRPRTRVVAFRNRRRVIKGNVFLPKRSVYRAQAVTIKTLKITKKKIAKNIQRVPRERTP